MRNKKFVIWQITEEPVDSVYTHGILEICLQLVQCSEIGCGIRSSVFQCIKRGIVQNRRIQPGLRPVQRIVQMLLIQDKGIFRIAVYVFAHKRKCGKVVVCHKRAEEEDRQYEQQKDAETQ